ncbi:MAG: homocysteine S-methyltransferase family protein [Anaerolineae bacterium]
MPERFKELLQRDVIFCDGAMGTMLQATGLLGRGCPEELNLTAPEAVLRVHAGYVEAGSDIILTNSFGGSRVKLAKRGLADKVREVNVAAARIAREAAGDRVLVAGSVGPLGELLQPLGRITPEEAADAFREHTLTLAEGGVDLFIIETMYDLAEIRIALEAAKETGLPVVCTMTFDTHYHTMMGVSPAQAVTSLYEWGADVIGANCGNGPAETEVAMRQMREACPEAVLIAQPNAGRPRRVGDQVVYDATPEEMAAYARKYVELGVKIVGACCGSTPEHIRAIVQALRP